MSTVIEEIVEDADEEVIEDQPEPKRLRKLRFQPGSWRRSALVVGVRVVLAAGWLGIDKYRNVSAELAGVRQTEADRDTAAKLAHDYALKSLTYTFEDPDAFFRSVEDGVSQTLKDKYVNATELLKGIMTQAQVTSSGEVLATDAVSQPGQVYQVVVSAAQTTRNLQNPKSRVSVILLQVTVNKTSDKWQVSDIGPKTGSHPAPDSPAALDPGPIPGR
jgi:Mce-associated membrane protein